MKSRAFVFLILALCFITTINLKAQIHSVSYPSNYLSEETIDKMVEESKKNGTQEWELNKYNDFLHQQLKKQQDAIANGTYNNKTIVAPPQVMAGCTNIGFENGNTSGWTMNMGDNSSATSLPCPSCITPGGSGGLYQIANSTTTATVNVNGTCSCDPIDCSAEVCTNGVDRFGGFPVVAPAPLGGSYSLLLNHSMCGDKMEQATQSFAISAANSTFTYLYAAVLQDGKHLLPKSSYFEAKVTDLATGNVIPCSEYTASAAQATSGSLVGWTASTVDPTVYYKPWTIVSLDLSSLINHTVTVEFTVSDCGYGGHFGYAYIDASCNAYSNQITVSNVLCNGGSTILMGPPGMATYSWSGPVTGNSQNLITGTPGTYTLSSTTGTGCLAPVLYYTLTQIAGTPPIISTTATSNLLCLGSPAVLSATGASSYIWSNGDTTSSITVSPAMTTTYTVFGSNGANTCGSSSSQTITVKPRPIVHLGNDTMVCGLLSHPIILNAGANNGYTYNWSTGASTNTISINNSGTYYVSVTSAIGCSASDTFKIIISGATHNELDTLVCDTSRFPVLLTAPTLTGTNNLYYWNYAGGVGPSLTIHHTGSYILNIYVNGSNCKVTDVFKVGLDTAKLFIKDAEFCNVPPLNTVSAGNYANYLWSTGATTNSITINNSGTYWVNVISSSGCVKGDTFNVTVKPIKHMDAMPNIVPQNHDGVNDFIDFGVYQFTTMQLDIYDRWGVKLFESNDPKAIWSPTCNDGTCFYIISYNTDCDFTPENKTLKGFITILK